MKIALTIAGSDSGGGAGIQADLKTFNQFKVFGTSVITAITAQNTKGVRAVHPVLPRSCGPNSRRWPKTCHRPASRPACSPPSELVRMVAGAVTEFDWPNYVCDPVMVATSGDRLLDADAEAVLREKSGPARGAGDAQPGRGRRSSPVPIRATPNPWSKPAVVCSSWAPALRW